MGKCLVGCVAGGERSCASSTSSCRHQEQIVPRLMNAQVCRSPGEAVPIELFMEIIAKKIRI